MSSESSPLGGSGIHGRGRNVVTLALLLLWLILIAFALLSITQPAWLHAISAPGREVEYNDFKNYGDDAMRQGRHLLAIAQYQAALAVAPEAVGAMVNLGTAWLKVGAIQQGEQILRDVLEKTKSPMQRGLVHSNLADLYERQGRIPAAIGELEQAIACGTDLPRRYSKLGKLLLGVNHLEESRQAFQSSLDHALDPIRSYREMLLRSAESFAQNEEMLAAVQGQQARLEDEDLLAPYDTEVIRRQLSHERTLAITHNHLGWVLIQLERFEEAERQFLRSQQIWPFNQNAKQNLAVLRQMKADRQEAEEEMR